MKVMKGKSHDMELHHFPVFSSKGYVFRKKKTEELQRFLWCFYIASYKELFFFEFLILKN